MPFSRAFFCDLFHCFVNFEIVIRHGFPGDACEAGVSHEGRTYDPNWIATVTLDSGFVVCECRAETRFDLFTTRVRIVLDVPLDVVLQPNGREPRFVCCFHLIPSRRTSFFSGGGFLRSASKALLAIQFTLPSVSMKVRHLPLEKLV